MKEPGDRFELFSFGLGTKECFQFSEKRMVLFGSCILPGAEVFGEG